MSLFCVSIIALEEIQTSPLTVTPLGLGKSVTESEVSLYPTLFSI